MFHSVFVWLSECLFNSALCAHKEIASKKIVVEKDARLVYSLHSFFGEGTRSVDFDDAQGTHNRNEAVTINDERRRGPPAGRVDRCVLWVQALPEHAIITTQYELDGRQYRQQLVGGISTVLRS